MVLVGIAQIIYGIYLYQEMDDFLKSSDLAKGMVVELKTKNDGMIAPVVEFVDSNGKKYVFTSRSSSRPAEYALHQNVEVVYSHRINKTQPEAYILNYRDIFILVHQCPFRTER